MLFYVLCFHIYRKAGFELDCDFVIVDGDLFYHAADECLAVFCLAGLFLDEGDHGLDPADFVFPKRSLCQNVLPPFTEGYYPFSNDKTVKRGQVSGSLIYGLCEAWIMKVN